MNKVCLIGRLTKDPEVRWSTQNDNICIARFGIAVDRRAKSRENPQVDFLNCTAFGKLAEHIEKYWKKGMKSGITGRIEANSYTDKAGNKRTDYQVIVEEIDFCEKKAETNNVALPDFMTVADNEELPFDF